MLLLQELAQDPRQKDSHMALGLGCRINFPLPLPQHGTLQKSLCMCQPEGQWAKEEMGPAAPERGLAFHKPEKQVGSCVSGFQESALLPSFLGLCSEVLCPQRAHPGKKGAQLTPRGELIMCSPLAVFLGWKMCHRGKNNEGAEISDAT